MVVPASTALTLVAGSGIVLPAGADGTLASGTTITPQSTSFTLSAGSYFFPNTFRYVGFTITEAPGNYSLGATAVTLPAGTQAVLGASASATQTQFFGSVTLTAPGGIFAQGVGSVLDVGAAALTIHTPYIGDQAVALAAGRQYNDPGPHSVVDGGTRHRQCRGRGDAEHYRHSGQQHHALG